MTLAELAEAIIVDTKGKKLDPEDRSLDIKIFLEICASLISLGDNMVSDDRFRFDVDTRKYHRNVYKSKTETDGKVNIEEYFSLEMRSQEGKLDYSKAVRLAHYSVKEYLVSKVIMEGRASRFAVAEASAYQYMAEVCLVYLLHFD